MGKTSTIRVCWRAQVMWLCSLVWWWFGVCHLVRQLLVCFMVFSLYVERLKLSCIRWSPDSTGLISQTFNCFEFYSYNVYPMRFANDIITLLLPCTHSDESSLSEATVLPFHPLVMAWSGMAASQNAVTSLSLFDCCSCKHPLDN